jgi:hypothetical protein
MSLATTDVSGHDMKKDTTSHPLQTQHGGEGNTKHADGKQNKEFYVTKYRHSD